VKKFLAVAAGACALLLSTAASYAADRVVFVGHWSESDPFFNVIRNSAQLAADQMGVKVADRAKTAGIQGEAALRASGEGIGAFGPHRPPDAT